MIIFMVVLSSAVLSGCSSYEFDFPPVTTTTTTTEKFDWFILNDPVTSLLNQNTPQTTTPALSEKLPQTSKATSSEADSENPEETYTRLFTDHEKSSSHLPSNHVNIEDLFMNLLKRYPAQPTTSTLPEKLSKTAKLEALGEVSSETNSKPPGESYNRSFMIPAKPSPQLPSSDVNIIDLYTELFKRYPTQPTTTTRPEKLSPTNKFTSSTTNSDDRSFMISAKPSPQLPSKHVNIYDLYTEWFKRFPPKPTTTQPEHISQTNKFTSSTTNSYERSFMIPSKPSPQLPSSDVNINDLYTELFKQYPPQPTTMRPEQLSQTNKFIPSTTNLYDRSFMITGKSSPQLFTNHENFPPSYLSNFSPTIRPSSSPRPVSVSTKPNLTPFSYNNAGLLSSSSPIHPQPNNVYHPPSNHFQYSQPSPPHQHELLPQFPNIPQEIPVPYKPPSFYNPQNGIPPLTSPNELPYYQPSYIPDENPIHFLHLIPYQNPLIPTVPREQPLSLLPQFHNGSLINYSPVPLVSLNENTGAVFGPSQSFPLLNYPLQSYGTPGYILASFVRSYIPQDQFHPLEFHVSQPPVTPLQPSGYGPPPPQLSEEDIISLIQNSYASPSPDVSSPSFNPSSFPIETYSNEPNFASVPINNGNVSPPYSSSPIKTSGPFSYSREPRTSVTSDGSDPPGFISGGSQPPIYGNPSNLHFL